uniref:Uncharacterized protein n=1 Tax=Anopheles culicifacies TaxID=139723 RepID=A0A182MHV6_9DIPT
MLLNLKHEAGTGENNFYKMRVDSSHALSTTWSRKHYNRYDPVVLSGRNAISFGLEGFVVMHVCIFGIFSMFWNGSVADDIEAPVFERTGPRFESHSGRSPVLLRFDESQEMSTFEGFRVSERISIRH